MNKSLVKGGLLSIAIAGSFPTAAMAAQCPDRFESTQFDYLGRNADKTKSYWLTTSNRADSFRVSAPGVSDIDLWQTSGPSTHITESNVVLNDNNGVHYVDRMKPNGSFDCLLQTRGQSNPLLPPTWRPPAKPKPPEVVRPEVPKLPEVVRPELPKLPEVVRPELPKLPEVVRPELPQLPEVARPELPNLPTVTRPGAIQVNMSGLNYQLSHNQLLQYCPSAKIDEQGNIDPASLEACPNLQNDLAPLTPGRDLVAPSEWNTWADFQYLNSENRRGFSPIEAKASTLSFGGDKLINPDFTLGAMLSFSNQDADTFAGKMAIDTDSIMAGPYFAYRFNPNWSLFGNAMAGRAKQDYRLLSLNGDRTVTKYSAALNLEGEYTIGEASFIRPKLGVNYNYETGKDYQLTGAFLGKQLHIFIDGRSHDGGQIQASTEFNTRLKTEQGQLFVPYVEAGLMYNYLQETQSVNPDWQGLVRAGIRTVAGKSFQIDVNASYQSIGVNNLNVWDCKVFVAYAF